MAREITIDGSGRLVIPKEVRDTHRLEAGSRLALIEEDDRLVLVPQRHDPSLIEKDGLLVIAGVEPIEVPDHRALRRERLGRLGGLE